MQIFLAMNTNIAFRPETIHYSKKYNCSFDASNFQNMNKLFALIYFSMVGMMMHGQDYKLEVRVAGFGEADVYLANFYGDRNTIIDTARSDTSGIVRFELPANFPSGMYRVYLDENVFFDLIFNKENITIVTDYNDLYEQLNVTESLENQLFYDFLRTKHDYRRKFDLLAPVNDYYPRNDSFFHIARAQYIGIQAEFLVYIDDVIEQYPNAWVTRIIRLQKPLFYDPSMDDQTRRDHSIEHYFDNFEFSDVELVKSNVFTTKAIEYMSLYSNPNYTQEQLENEFIKAVDKIMYKAMDNSLVYEFIVEYLVGGFERYHFDKVLDYIAENYAPEQCENEERKSDLQTRLTKYAELSIGKEAPEIFAADPDGNTIKLSGIKSDHVLVIFWASWCPHCNTLLPEIHNIYQSSLNPRTLQVLSVSLDNDLNEWNAALAKGSYSWINVSELKGWDSKTAIDYNVYATPTMFLLDRNKNILAKPITLDELKTALFKENLLK
jgi:thiol-disulfide isomerase/thioredoxin